MTFLRLATGSGGVRLGPDGVPIGSDGVRLGPMGSDWVISHTGVRVRVSVSIVYRIATGGYSWIWPALAGGSLATGKPSPPFS